MIDECVTGESVKANTDQQKFLNIIAKRMKEETQDLMEGRVGNSEPLSLLCMGGPGVGKSYISKAMRRLFDMVKYEDKRHYQFAAYQAVVISTPLYSHLGNESVRKIDFYGLTIALTKT